MLFGELWFENEFCFLYSSTNVGKSILAVQIADSISKGEAINGFKLEAEKQAVLYCDFELSEKQFERRYSEDFQNHYSFDDNFERMEIDPDENIPEGYSFEHYLCLSLEAAIVKKSAKVLIIDNLTFLKSGTESAKDALPLVKGLKGLKEKYGLSLLVLAHTPKLYGSHPITKDQMSGSSTLMNFCDSSFAIGESSTGKQMRYIKQIKVRSSEMVFDAENVAICEIVKPTNFLHFEFVKTDTENKHLKKQNKEDETQLIADVKQLRSEGKSLRQVGDLLGIDKNKVSRLEKK